MRQLNSKRDLHECGRIATAILDMMSSASASGAGHPPVTLDANAATVLTIGADPTTSPQELGLQKQVANTVWAGPAAGANAIPTFRALVVADIAHDILSATHPDTTAANVVRGDLMTGQGATPKWARLGLGADGYVLGATATDVAWIDPAALLPIAPVAQGDIIIADAVPEWSILTLGAAAGYALVTTATTAVWDQTPTWTGDHTWDDGVGDSPMLALVGGSNDDTGYIFLDDDAVAGNSDLVARLCAADADSHFSIQSNAPAEVAYIDAVGNADFAGHLAVGGAASVSADHVVLVNETSTAVAGAFIGESITCTFSPGAGYTTSVYGMYFTVNLTTAQARTGGALYGIYGSATIANGVDARDAVLMGGQFLVDCEDAGVGGGVGVATGVGLDVYTPFVDTGSCTSGYGIRVNQGTVGAGSITTLHGVYIAAITAGNTNYAIYSAGGNSYHAGDVSIGGTVAPGAQLHVDQSSATGAQPVVFLDQGDVDQQHIVVSINGTDVNFPAILQLDVTGAPTLGWVEAADQLTWNKHLSLTAGDLYFASGFGIIHADSVAAGMILRADGTRYIPANPAGTLPIAPVAQGDIIIADAVPEWSILTLGAAAGYALVTTATTAVWDQTPTWTGGHTWDDGAGDSPMLALVGGSNDDTGYIFLDDDAVAGNSDLVVRLCAADADSRFIIQSNAPAQVAYIDAAGNEYLASNLSVGGIVAANYHANIYNAAVSFAGTPYAGLRIYEKKTGGASTNANYMYGMQAYAELDQVGGVIGNMYGGYLLARITAGNVGDGGAARSLYGMQFTADLDGGTVTGSAMGLYAYVDQEAANTVNGSVYGGYISVDADGTVGGSVHMLFLTASSNVDYGIYQTGTLAVGNYLAGDTSIGGTVAPSAQLHVDQSSGTGAQPVAFLDQGDVDQQHIVCSMSGADVNFPAILELDVTGAPTLGWVEAADQLTWNKHLSLTAGDLYFASGFGIIHADSVAAGMILRADGTRYVPANPAGTLPIAPVAQGDIIIADAVPEWSILTLGAAAGYALVTTAATAVWDQTPTWTGDHTWDDGVGDSPMLNFVGGTADDTCSIFLADAAAGDSDLVARLCATDADSHFSIQSNAPAEVAYIDAAGNQYLAGNLAVGAAVSANYHVRVYDAALSFAGASYYGLNIYENKTGGASTNADYFLGQQILVILNQAAGVVGNMYGSVMTARLTDGSVGDGGGARSFYGMEFTADLDGGTVTGSAFGLSAIVDQEAANTVDGSMYGGYISVDADGTVGGSVYVLRLIASSNVDYGIYQTGTCTNYLAGDTSIGGTVAPSAQLHVDQSSATGAQPVVFLDQGDVDEEHIVVSVNGTDVNFPAILQLDVTGAPTLGWVEANDQLTWNKHLSLTAGDLYFATAHGLDYVDDGDGNLLVLNGGLYVPGSATIADISDLAFAAPNLTLGVANAEGAADTVIRTDATILVFDAVNPVTLAVATAAAPGVATVTARRDHAHAITSSSNPGAAASILATDASGQLDITGHTAFGDDATVSADVNVFCVETYTVNTGTLYGIYSAVQAEPTGDFDSSYYGIIGHAQLYTEHEQTDGTIGGVLGVARVSNNLAATLVHMLGGGFYTYVEDATVEAAWGVVAATPAVDTGSLEYGYGLRVARGTVGAGNIVTLCGVYIEDMTMGDTNYAIYSVGGNSYHAGKVAIGGTVAPAGILHVDQDVDDAAIPVLVLDQADLSEGTINFIASARGAIAGATNSAESVRVELGGVVYRLALYTDA